MLFKFINTIKFWNVSTIYVEIAVFLWCFIRFWNVPIMYTKEAVVASMVSTRLLDQGFQKYAIFNPVIYILDALKINKFFNLYINFVIIKLNIVFCFFSRLRQWPIGVFCAPWSNIDQFQSCRVQIFNWCV